MLMEGQVVAATRFGLGVTPGMIHEMGRDPRGWVAQQIATNDGISSYHIPSLQERLNILFPKKGDGDAKVISRKREAFINRARDSRIARGISTSTPFAERLSRYWFDHFNISVSKLMILGLADWYEADAIRPHVLGRFRDMLGATARHPAMIWYLDNLTSVGPRSEVGRRRNAGLNENYARELLELHTLGVNGGYTQRDVREVAKILSGWRAETRPGEAAVRVFFDPAYHEPGDKKIMGKVIKENGAKELDDLLDYLASSPATAAHVAWRFSRHFIADSPPDDLVKALKDRFLRTDGDLRELALGLIEFEDAWKAPAQKALPPEDWGIAFARLISLTGDDAPARIRNAATAMGQMGYAAPSPKGWPDELSAWLTPETIIARSSWARRLSEDKDDLPDPRSILKAYGDFIGDAERMIIFGAPSSQDGLALIAAMPQFNLR